MIRGDDWIAEALENSNMHEPERLTPGVYDFHHKAHKAHKERTKTI
jgi:hypothetical protein